MLYFFIGLVFGIGARLLIDYVIKADDINNIKEFLNIVIDKLKPKPKATVTSYGYNSATKIMSLEYSDGNSANYYYDFVTWRTIPDMTEVTYEFGNVLDSYMLRIKFEASHTNIL